MLLIVNIAVGVVYSNVGCGSDGSSRDGGRRCIGAHCGTQYGNGGYDDVGSVEGVDSGCVITVVLS